MIEKIDERLGSWVASVFPIISVSFNAPSNEETEPKIFIYLLDIVDSPPLRGGTGRPPLQLSLRYLITTSVGKPEEVHRMLGQLVFAAMETPDFEVELKSPSVEMWQAFEVIPRPAFFLRVPLKKERPELPIEPVRHPLTVNVTSITSLRGIVLGPGLVPVANARVELPVLRVSTYTDTKGCFRFPAVPQEPDTKELHILARNQEFNVTVNHPPSESEMVEVTLDTLIN